MDEPLDDNNQHPPQDEQPEPLPAEEPKQPQQIRLVSVKFRTAGRHYDFNAGELPLKSGDKVVVETNRGRALGSVVHDPRLITPDQAPDDLKCVLRMATDEDFALAQATAENEEDAYRFCLERIKFRQMDMKLVRAEYLFDGSKIIFYFTADGRVDFRELVKDLAHHFHTRIEMRQIGVRDEAKLIGGIGVCGRELCCCTFLTEFAPVSVKMAKEQGLALNPSKISGQCGRLLCCLAYEFETYCDLKKGMPKCGRKINFQGSEVEVTEQNVLARTIKVRTGDGSLRELGVDELQAGMQATDTSRDSEAEGDEPSEEEFLRQGREKDSDKRRTQGRGPRKPRRSTQQRPAPKQQDVQQSQPSGSSKQSAPSAPPPDKDQSAGENKTEELANKKKRNRGRRRPRRKKPQESNDG